MNQAQAIDRNQVSDVLGENDVIRKDARMRWESIGSLTEKHETWNPRNDVSNGDFCYIDLSSVDQTWKEITAPRQTGHMEAPCPCGCGDVIELMLIPEATPHWRLIIGTDKKPSLKPSVWRNTGCRSHFWLRGGSVEWCKSRESN